MGIYKTGDVVTLTRNGKAFLSQFTNVGAYVSLCRTLGQDPEGEVAQMQSDIDAMWHAQMLVNLEGIDGCAAAMGEEDGDHVGRLMDYLTQKAADEQIEEAPKRKRRKKRVSS
jgi:hypothetical protein